MGTPHAPRSVSTVTGKSGSEPIPLRQGHSRMDDGTGRHLRRCRDCAGRGRVRRWYDILDSNAEMIRCLMCFGTGTIPETETASKPRDTEIRRHEARNAAEGQAAGLGLERWLSAKAAAKRKAEAEQEAEMEVGRVPATQEAEPRTTVGQRGAGASSREAARTAREAEANEQSASPSPPRKQPPPRSPRPRRRRRRGRAFRTVMALTVMFAILGGYWVSGDRRRRRDTKGTGKQRVRCRVRVSGAPSHASSGAHADGTAHRCPRLCW